MDRNLIVLAGGMASRMRASALDGGDRYHHDLLKEAHEKPKTMLGIGPDRRPFLDYLLLHAREAGVASVTIVVGASDETIIQRYGNRKFPPVPGLSIGFVRQPIPEGRTKPLGTADALLRALDARPEWKGATFIVCNSDNLYSPDSFRLLLESPCRNALIDYDPSALRFDASRIARFALIRKDADGFVADIVEKPDTSTLEQLAREHKPPGVSMNIFRLEFDLIYPFLLSVPPDRLRGEKELPTAVALMVRMHPRSLCAIPMAEHVPDLTQVDDIPEVQRYLGSLDNLVRPSLEE
jgi:NDP-sugar pyrophosphorylase family protein